ncbi:MAG: hypothetical protein ABR529_03190 [Actinomycetota bacterium]
MEQPQPAVVEARPYRKDDTSSYSIPEYRRLRDQATTPSAIGHGADAVAPDGPRTSTHR